MKVLVYHILILTIIQGYAQPLLTKVIDSSTKENIPNVHISTSGGRLLEISDYFGEFTIDESFKNDTLVFSCIGYKSSRLLGSELFSKQIIELSQDTTTLQSITITPLSAQEIVLKCIESIPSNYLETRNRITGQQSLIKYKDSIFQERVLIPIEVIQDSEYKVLQSDTLIEEVKEIIEECILFDHIINSRAFLSSQNFDAWEFEFSGYTHSGDQELMVVTAKYRGETTVNHSGKIYVNPEDFGILQIEYYYEWFEAKEKRTNQDSIYSRPMKWEGFASYSKSKGTYTLSNLGYSIEKEIIKKIRHSNYEHLYKEEIVSEFRSDALLIGH